MFQEALNGLRSAMPALSTYALKETKRKPAAMVGAGKRLDLSVADEMSPTVLGLMVQGLLTYVAVPAMGACARGAVGGLKAAVEPLKGQPLSQIYQGGVGTTVMDSAKKAKAILGESGQKNEGAAELKEESATQASSTKWGGVLFAAGVTLALTPCTTAKVYSQLNGGTITSSLKHIMAEGTPSQVMRKLFSGATSGMMRDAGFVAAYFPAYDFFKQQIESATGEKLGSAEKICLSTATAMLTAVLTHYPDTVGKYQRQALKNGEILSFQQAFKLLLKELPKVAARTPSSIAACAVVGMVLGATKLAQEAYSKYQAERNENEAPASSKSTLSVEPIRSDALSTQPSLHANAHPVFASLASEPGALYHEKDIAEPVMAHE